MSGSSLLRPTVAPGSRIWRVGERVFVAEGEEEGERGENSRGEEDAKEEAAGTEKKLRLSAMAFTAPALIAPRQN